MSPEEIRTRWRQLDPVFVRGMQRSGTSVMGQALRRMGMAGFGEGHLWFELVKPFEKLRDEGYRPNLRVSSYALGEGRVSDLERYVACALDQFHRDHLSGNYERWFDKSPGAEAVRIVPLLAELFPRAQFVFMYRNGITTVHSAVRLWADHEFWSSENQLFQTMCRAWVETMSSWRDVRGLLPGRTIEVAQEELVSEPHGIASRLTEFLGVPESRSRVADVFQSRRVGTAFPDRPAGDYNYQIDWDDEQRAYFIEKCEEEMAAWGFEMDFDPGPAQCGLTSGDDDAAPLDAQRERGARAQELEDEGRALRERGRGIDQGSVTRLLKWLRSLRL
jgi:hypothetical protein